MLGLESCRRYAAAHGHARVPSDYVDPETGHRTGYWVTRQRRSYARSEMSPERTAELAALPGWVWFYQGD